MRTHRVVLTLLLLTTPTAFAREPFPDVTTAELNNTLLKLHNEYRARHGTPALVVDPSIVAYAKSRAKAVSTHEGLSEGHRGLDHKYGENLYWGGSETKAGASGIVNAAVKSWYDEISQYNFKTGGFSGATGHFTQLVWKGTTKMGCAVAQGKGSKWYETYVVCNYQAPGNMMGAFQTNVMPKR
ncbi:CAP family protein [Pyxidicoccus sp. MSG2]|uniref:CAP family protein n=1 Tax=Pyxidicoccus sp. MSG2 TaxID=2996790 RepID=UPI002270931F|nr:CAP family protein [Pyxidicoccus sp. MSG2]MCY1022933.1 CAP family protein [Pyxidicoccus sp. MSG2]